MADFLVNLDVDDLARAERFYTEAFGLEAGRRFGRHALELLGGPTPIYLLVKKPGSRPAATIAQARSYERHWTPAHLDFVVDDLELAVEKAVRAGAKLEPPVETHAWGRIAMLADPFGHGFCLLQFVGRGYDEIAT